MNIEKELNSINSQVDFVIENMEKIDAISKDINIF